MKRVIINADDFGLSIGVNQGIIKAYREGILTSTSLMVNMPGFNDALKLIKENEKLGIGIHINVVRGKPVLPADSVFSLVNNKGYFLQDVWKIVGNFYLRRLNPDELEKECKAQIEKALNNGVCLTHIDSEKHLFFFKPFFQIMVKIAKYYGILKVRFVDRIHMDISNLSGVFRKQFYGIIALNFLSGSKKHLLKAANIKNPDYCYGVCEAGNMNGAKYKKIFYSLRNGTTEIICHPGYMTNEWQEYPLCLEKFYLNKSREKELKALLNPELKILVDKLGIELISYQKL